MFRFSLKALLTLPCFVAAACLTLNYPSFPLAIATALLMLLTLLTVMVLTIRRRRFWALLMIGLCGCYLVIADGGVFPGGERSLPTEWFLSQNTMPIAYENSGLLYSRSLSLWAWRVGRGEVHKDPNYIAPPGKRIKSDVATVLILSSGVAPQVKLPTFNVMSVQIILVSAKRDAPQNRPYFIIGHCWFVILVLLLLAFFMRPRAVEDTSEPQV